MPNSNPSRNAKYLHNAPLYQAFSRKTRPLDSTKTLIFVATTPFSNVQFPKSVAFVAGFQAILFVNDFITATILFAHFSILRWRSLLVLAGGYLFTSLIVISYALAFPGFIWSGGLGAQTSGWLYLFWHCGLPLATIAYVSLNSVDRGKDRLRASTPMAISLCAAIAVTLVCTLTWASVAAGAALPPLFLDAVHISSFGQIVTAAIVLLSALALVLVWIRGQSALDLWLMVVLWAWLLESAFFVLVTALRFSLSYYTSRVYAVITASIVLLVLLSEMTKLYANVVRVNALLHRERANRLLNIDAITAAIAHEVKQPLATISTNLQAALTLLEGMSSVPHAVHESLSEADSNVFRAVDTLDSIRSLFATNSQSRRPLDINNVIRETVDSLHGELQNRGVTTNCDFALNLPLVAGHNGQLREVILNLVHNALEAMDTVKGGGGRLEITTSRLDTKAIVIAVKDTGPGIIPTNLQNIFDAFITTKENGMGLGLPICRMIIERHGGQLSAHSNGKHGALFKFTLPLVPPDEIAVASDGADR